MREWWSLTHYIYTLLHAIKVSVPTSTNTIDKAMVEINTVLEARRHTVHTKNLDKTFCMWYAKDSAWMHLHACMASFSQLTVPGEDAERASQLFSSTSCRPVLSRGLMNVCRCNDYTVPPIHLFTKLSKSIPVSMVGALLFQCSHRVELLPPPLIGHNAVAACP